MDVKNSIIGAAGAAGKAIAVADAQNTNQVAQTNSTEPVEVTVNQVENPKQVDVKAKFSIKSLVSRFAAKSPLNIKGIAGLGVLGLVRFLPTNYFVLASTAIVLWNMPKVKVDAK